MVDFSTNIIQPNVCGKKKMKKELIIPTMYIMKSIGRDNFIGNLIGDLWIPLYALSILQLFSDISVYYKIIIYLLTFFILYEIGYIFSDNIGIKYEKKSSQRKVYNEKIPDKHFITAIVLRVVLITAIFLIFDKLFVKSIIIAYLATMAIFLLHSLIREKYRLVTYLCLKIMKGYAPYLFLISILLIQEKTLVLVGLIGEGIYYSIPYYVRKINGKLDFDLLSTKNSFIKSVAMISLFIITAYILNISVITTTYFVIAIIVHYIIVNIIRTAKQKIKSKRK